MTYIYLLFYARITDYLETHPNVRTCELNSRQAFERFGAMEPGPMVVMERNHSDHDDSQGRHNHRARSMGFAFITFLEPSSAAKAVAEMHGRQIEGLTHKGRKLKVSFFTDNSRDKAKADKVDTGEDFGAVAKRFGIQLDGDAQQGGGSGFETTIRDKNKRRAGAELPPGMSSQPVSQPVTKYPKHF